jgi:hypothetical protein
LTAALLRWSPLLAILLCLPACTNGASGLAPPGTQGSDARLFFPTALATDDGGNNLYIANSNFDLAFNAGTLVQIPTSAFDSDSVDVPFPGPPGKTIPFSIGTLDSFAGNMTFSTLNGANRLYVTTRQRPTVSIAPVQPNGSLGCAQSDCRLNAVVLDTFQDPFALAKAQLPLPSSPATTSPVLLVSALGQLPTNANGVGENTAVAVIPEPANLPDTGVSSNPPFSSVAYTVNLGVPGSNSIAVGPASEILVGGCFLLVQGGSQVPCVGNPDKPEFYRTNILRVFDGNAGLAAQVFQRPLGPLLGTSTSGTAQTRDIAVSPAAPVLYVATATPNALLVTALPGPGTTTTPTSLGTIPLSNAPGRIHVLSRAPLSDLVAVTATESNSLLIVDPSSGNVVSQIQPVGNGPFGLASIRKAALSQIVGGGEGNRIFVSLFNGCGVAAVDVPDAAPERAALVSTVGACP